MKMTCEIGLAERVMGRSNEESGTPDELAPPPHAGNKVTTITNPSALKLAVIKTPSHARFSRLARSKPRPAQNSERSQAPLRWLPASCEKVSSNARGGFLVQGHLDDAHDVLPLTKALIWFVFIGTATVSVAVLAHLLPSALFGG
jgi:hypothetical protein